MVQVRLLIDAVDRSANLLEPGGNPSGQWEIESYAFGEMSTAVFQLWDPTNSISLNSGKSVVFENFGDATEDFFGGVLTEVAEQTVGIGKVINCKAVGWMFDLMKTAVNFIYIGRSDQFIITDPTDGIFGTNGAGKAVEKDLSAYTATTTTVLEGTANTNKIVFRGQTVREVMDTFASWSGYVWGVEADQTVYYRPFTAQTNSDTLSDNPDEVTSFPYYSFRRFRNFSEIVNKVYVYGGRFHNENQTREYSNESSVKTDFIVPDEWRASDSQTDHKVDVDKNTGTDGAPVWTAQTVGFPEEVGSFDVIWSELGRSFKFTSAPSILEKAFRVNGDIFDQLFWEESDPVSIDANGTYEATIKDETLRDSDAVENRAHAELLKRAAEGERIILKTTRDGFQVGKLVELTNAIHGISAVTYLVNKMVMTGLGGTLTEYELTLQKVPA